MVSRNCKSQWGCTGWLPGVSGCAPLESETRNQHCIAGLPSGMVAWLQRLTSSKAVLWKGTRPFTSGMSRSYTNLEEEEPRSG